MERKIVSGIMLTMLFIGTLTLAFNIRLAESEPNTWTVDDDGGVDFTEIQDAINAASPGDSIYVYNGTYYENVVMNKSVLLIGENKVNTIIDGSGAGNIVTITVNNVTVSNFTIQNSGHFAPWPRGVYLNGTNNTIIQDNIITNNFYGILIEASCNNTISNNIIANNSDGISISYYDGRHNSGNTFRNNTITGNEWSFGVPGSDQFLVLDNLIQDIDASNTVDGKPICYWVNRHNEQVPSDAGYVGLINCTNITVRNLNLTNNYQGILVAYTKSSLIIDNNVTNIYGKGIELQHSEGNTISSNNITNNLQHAIYLSCSNASSIMKNKITTNRDGISLHDSYDNTISSNNITNNDDGITLFENSSDNIILSNKIDNNSYAGIELYHDCGDGNIILGNEITNNEIGIYVMHLAYGNIIFHNNFINNTDSVISHYYTNHNIWDDGYPSGGNYWSDYTGVDADGDGIGDYPYVIDADDKDNYPLMNPAGKYIEVGPGKTYSTIQTAVDAARPRDIILVYDGNYNEAVYINKTLTLKAASSPIINGSQSVITNYGARDAVIFVEDAADVIIEGFDIEGNGLGDTNPKSYGVIYENSSGAIRNCIVSPNTVGDLQSTGIACWDNSSLIVFSCTIENFGRIGVFYFSGCSGGVYDSTIIGQVYGGEGDVNYGIEVEAYDFPCDIEIIGNEIYNCSNTFSPEPTWSSAGIVIDGWRAFYDLSPSTVVIKENNIHDNYYGIEVVSNSLSHAHYNNIQNNREYGVVSDSDYLGDNATFDARFNYWSHCSGPGPVGPGEGDNVTQYVDFEPWLSCYTPYTTTMLYIDPPTIDKQAIEESTTVEVEVVIANVTDLYGFDLKLTWNDTLLDLAAVEYQTNLDQIWSNWDDTKNETGAGWYRLVAHETKENGYSGDATLINLAFHIKYGPCYIEENYQLSTLIHFALVKLSDPNSTAICTKVQDAKYTIHAVKPKLVLLPGHVLLDLTVGNDKRASFWAIGDANRDGYIDYGDLEYVGDAHGSEPGDPNWNPDADLNGDLKVNVLDLVIVGVNFGENIWSYFGLSPQININRFSESITVQVWLVNASKVYDYTFNITYDTEILHAVNVEWSNFLAGPYYHKSWHINETTGVIEISLAETAQAPPAEGDGLLVNITFRHEVIVWKDCPLWTNLLNCTIEFDWWKLSVRCPELHEITGDMIDISNAEYSYTPIQGDVNSDGQVDGFDLRLVSVYYDQSQPEDYDLNCDGIIDLFDLIYIATEIDC